MAFSMHSHSGQFCPGHAKDGLEVIVKTAIARGMKTFALTEHMPRISEKDLYPEEIEAGDSVAHLPARHEAFIVEAIRLREVYRDKIKILIGFEGEWIRASYAEHITKLAADPNVDYFIGSVHHVHEIPIDYDAKFYRKARDLAGGTDQRLFENYFDSQYEMLKLLSPIVVGHFDLVRLLSDEPNRDLREMGGVWTKIVRNLKLIVEQNGLLEINTSGLRKGLHEPYPARSICEEFLRLGGKLTLSDDSHGVMQVGTNYTKAFEYLRMLRVEKLFTLARNTPQIGTEMETLDVCSITLSTIEDSFLP